MQINSVKDLTTEQPDAEVLRRVRHATTQLDETRSLARVPLSNNLNALPMGSCEGSSDLSAYPSASCFKNTGALVRQRC